MKMDRDINADGRGKYALVLMRNYNAPRHPSRQREVELALETLESNDMIDYGEAGSPSEFFLIRLKDRFAGDALRAYADASKRYADTFASTDEGKYRSFYAWACAVLKMAGRAGELSDHCKDPD